MTTATIDGLERPERSATRVLFIVRRIVPRMLSGVLVLFAAASLTFLAQALLPGDRATLLLNQQTGQTIQRTAQELAPINAEFGFNAPLIVQYGRFIGGLLTGNLGTSYQLHKPVAEIIGEQFMPTLTLTVTALLLAWVLTIVWTLLTARRRRLVSTVGTAAETIAAGLPQYWLGVVLLVVFAIGLKWFPVIGGTSVIGLVLPAFTLAIPLAGFMGQATRTEFEKQYDQPFVTSARMRGMGDVQIRLRHVLRHAVLPGITLSGWALGSLFSGAVIAESVFARPGLGTVLLSAVNSRDLPVVTGIVILIALLYVVANIIVDIAYVIVDPRLRTS
jgi:peptide/nickel transport system permease protein